MYKNSVICATNQPYSIVVNVGSNCAGLVQTITICRSRNTISNITWSIKVKLKTLPSPAKFIWTGRVSCIVKTARFRFVTNASRLVTMATTIWRMLKIYFMKREQLSILTRKKWRIFLKLNWLIFKNGWMPLLLQVHPNMKI